MLCVKRCVVSGGVQGVFYRASTQQEALRLKVTGYAKNLVDGRVEVLAVGEADAVAALAAWLWRGSPTSQVAHVVVVDVDAATLVDIPTAFVIK